MTNAERCEELKKLKFVDNTYIRIGGRSNGKTLEAMGRAYRQGWNDAIDRVIKELENEL